MVSSNDSIIVNLKNSIIAKINTLIGNHNSSNTAHLNIQSDMISTFSSEFDNALNASNAQTVQVTVTYTNGDTETINLFKEVQP